jgi:hypothetical protein
MRASHAMGGAGRRHPTHPSRFGPQARRVCVRAWGSPFSIGRGHITMIAQKPLFYVVLRDGDQWLIEAEWPDGSIEHVQAFKAYSEAVNWVKTHTQTWLQKQV